MKQRIEVLDQIRGFSLYGILIVNMFLFQYGVDHPKMVHMDRMDKITTVIIEILFSNSFMPLFAFMFGVSTILIKRGLEKQNIPCYSALIKRFITLMLIGIFHTYIIWDEDILLSYGITGMLLLIFLNANKIFLTILSIFWWLVLPLLCYFFTGNFPVLSGDGLGYHIIFNLSWIDQSDFSFALNAPIATLPYFLFGIVCIQTNMFFDFKLNKKRNKYLFLILFIVGCTAKSLPLFNDDNNAMIRYCSEIGKFTLTTSYIFGILYIVTTTIGMKFLSIFSAVGKTSLSNYLFQSILFTCLFKQSGILFSGIGIFHYIGVLSGVFLATIVFSIQIYMSQWWLSHYSFGPIEWLVRKVTYSNKYRTTKRGKNTHPST
ncbi:DUF418 domain-containing protein [Bacillus toyonensis]|uniref:DUF418 domain-containing protein n=1 Tax=Bacillus toyonensis TaxID=155322 RepID=A0A2B5Y1V8_9BACI|nr:DUF418 domain-containing protein [Bacillus toyonensis]PGB02624.1 hypothetical protein COL93_10495 [Bacillus toyonensis]PHD55892.1 hypothetical protein COF40_29910 [Bacillus toyonensis]